MEEELEDIDAGKITAEGFHGNRNADQLAIEGFNFRDTEHGTPMAAGVVKGVQRPVGVAGDHEVIACNRRPRQGLRRKVCDPPDVDP